MLAESLRNLLADARKSSISNAIAREQEAMLAEKRRALAIRNAQLSNELVYLDEALACIDEFGGLWRTEVTTLPVRITTNISERRRIESMIDDILARISAKCGERAAELKEFGEIDGEKKRAKRRKSR